MPLDDDYLRYPHRKPGMDHTLYPASNLFERKAVTWPDDKPVAVWITVVSEYFPLTVDKAPVKAPGHMVTPHPDLRSYTTRDYGNRVGIFRIMNVLDKHKAPATAFVNAAIATRYPHLVQEMAARDWEIAGHGRTMNDAAYGGLDKGEEAARLDEALATLRKATNAPVSGWLSPGRFESMNTPALLAGHGMAYLADWANDDMPYAMTTEKGPITAMPYAHDLDDRQNLVAIGHTEAAYEAEILTAFDFLVSEAAQHGGRILHLPLTPYVIGQPFRIRSLETILATIAASGKAWFATGTDILDHWKAQQ